MRVDNDCDIQSLITIFGVVVFDVFVAAHTLNAYQIRKRIDNARVRNKTKHQLHKGESK